MTKLLKQEYAVTDASDDELLDVISLTKKEAIEYKRKNPTHLLELIEEMEDIDFNDIDE